ncbi:hypothetical protein AYO38_04150 [bacterium SCGC AG-212-C10]|nr:hypothetical protein AYO38_04150 [bacterium SCGC AG-212-C10]
MRAYCGEPAPSSPPGTPYAAWRAIAAFQPSTAAAHPTPMTAAHDYHTTATVAVDFLRDRCYDCPSAAYTITKLTTNPQGRPTLSLTCPAGHTREARVINWL